jgi:hypothetical protein
LLPYRLGLGQAEHLPPMDKPWPQIFREIQRVFDPRGCMAASRYEPLWRGDSTPDSTNASKEMEVCP